MALPLLNLLHFHYHSLPWWDPQLPIQQVSLAGLMALKTFLGRFGLLHCSWGLWQNGVRAKLFIILSFILFVVSLSERRDNNITVDSFTSCMGRAVSSSFG